MQYMGLINEISLAVELDHVKTAEKIYQLRYDGSTNQNQSNPAEDFNFFA